MEAVGVILSIIYLAMIVLIIVSMWKLFEKAGEPGWACIIPIYNVIVLLRIAGKKWTNILWFLLPGIGGIILQITIVTGVSKSFGKGGTGFGAGLFFLPFIFYPILGLGNAEYQGKLKTNNNSQRSTNEIIYPQKHKEDGKNNYDEMKTGIEVKSKEKKMKECPECGNLIPDVSVKCKYCQSKL